MREFVPKSVDEIPDNAELHVGDFHGERVWVELKDNPHISKQEIVDKQITIRVPDEPRTFEGTVYERADGSKHVNVPKDLFKAGTPVTVTERKEGTSK